MDDATRRIDEFNRNNVQAKGCSVEICGPMSGHSVKPIAFCDSPETAQAIVTAMLSARKEN